MVIVVAGPGTPVQGGRTGVTVYVYVVNGVTGVSLHDVVATVPAHVPPAAPAPPVRWIVYPVAPGEAAHDSATEIVTTPLGVAVGCVPSRRPAAAAAVPCAEAVQAAALAPVRTSATIEAAITRIRVLLAGGGDVDRDREDRALAGVSGRR